MPAFASWLLTLSIQFQIPSKSELLGQWLQTRVQLKHVLRQLDINCVFDVGANEGQFGVALRGMGYAGWILSFERVAEIFQTLQSVAKNDSRWRVFPYALGAESGNLPINISEFRVLSSFVAPRED